MGKAYDPDPTDWEFVDACTDHINVGVRVADSVSADDAIFIAVETAQNRGDVYVHVPFEQAEEIALDILARLKDRGFYGNL